MCFFTTCSGSPTTRGVYLTTCSGSPTTNSVSLPTCSGSPTTGGVYVTTYSGSSTTSKTKFKCNECDLSCAIKAKLKKHVKSHHTHESIPQMDGNDTINEVLENVECSAEKCET